MKDIQYDAAGRRPFTFDRVVRMVLAALAVFFAVWLLNRLSSVLLPFLVAWLIAYMLEPFVLRNQQVFHSRGRLLPVMFTLSESVLLITALGIIFIPSIVNEMHQVASMVKAYALKDADVAFVPPSVHQFLREHIDFNRISEEMTRQDFKSLFNVATRFISGGVNVLLSIVNWFLVVLYVIFIMLDYESLLNGFKHMVPPRYRNNVFSIMTDVKDSMNHYFRGQALVAMCVGILFSLGFLIVGIPLGIILGMFIGLLNMVPYLQLISIPVTTLLCLVYSMQSGVEFWTLWWECMAVYIIVQCIQDLFLTPKIMGKAMGLNPAIILLSLSVWGSLLGFIGLIIALPLTTLMLAYYNRYIINRNDNESPHQRHDDAKAIRAVEEDL